MEMILDWVLMRFLFYLTAAFKVKCEYEGGEKSLFTSEACQLNWKAWDWDWSAEHHTQHKAQIRSLDQHQQQQLICLHHNYTNMHNIIQLTAARPCPSVRSLRAAAVSEAGHRGGGSADDEEQVKLEAALRCRCCCCCWCWCWWCGRATLHRRRQKRMSGCRFPSSRQPNPLIQTQPLLLPQPAAAATPAAGAATRGALSSQGASFVWAKVGDELMMPLRAARKIHSWAERAEANPFIV